MNTSYAGQIEEITQSIFATMLGMELVRLDGFDEGDPERLLATIQIAGPTACSVVLGLSENAAAQSAAAMLQMPLDDVTAADQRDVAAELVNMIGGNLKSLLPGPSYLSLPTVVAGRDVDLQVSGAELIDDLALACDQGNLRIRRYVRDLTLGA